MKSVLRLIGSAVAGIALAGAAMAQEPIRIALVHGISGHALEAFSKQSHTGFELGLEYATDGTNMVRGRPVELIVKDTQFKPDVAAPFWPRPTATTRFCWRSAPPRRA